MLAVLALLMAAFALQAGDDTQPLVGKWNMVSITPEGENLKWVLIIKELEGQTNGRCSLRTRAKPAPRTFRSRTAWLSFKRRIMGEYYEIELKLADGQLNGTWSNGSDSGKTTGTKAEG